MPDLLTPNPVRLPPCLATSLHLWDHEVYEIYFDIRQGLRVKDKEERMLVGEGYADAQPRMSFSWEQESSLSGLWLSRGSASSLLDVVPGKRGVGVDATGDVGKVVISMLPVIHPHGPWGPIFRLVRLPRKGQAQVSQKLEAHTLGLASRNDEEMHAGSNQSLQHSGARVVGGHFSACLTVKISN